MNRFFLGFSTLAILSLPLNASALDELYLESETGDYVGQGQNLVYEDTYASFFQSEMPANASEIPDSVSITVASRGFQSSTWRLSFATTDGPLAVGDYDNAKRFVSNNGNPGLEVFGEGRGCNRLEGSFSIKQISHHSDFTVKSLEATFEQRCENFDSTLRGTLFFNTTPACYQYESHCEVKPGGVNSDFVEIVGGSCSDNSELDRYCAQFTCEDVDGDGWGWDGFSSCKMNHSNNSIGECLDTDGDGWGWNGVESCKPTN